MTGLRIWIAASHDPAHRNGGWAWVRAGGPDVAGWAGGERRTTKVRMVLAGFLSSLKDLPAAPLAVVAPRADAIVLHAILKPPAEPLGDELDLRAALAKALQRVSWTLAVGDPSGPTPATFTSAWADTASEKAKMGGAFTVAIPKVNLSRLKGL